MTKSLPWFAAVAASVVIALEAFGNGARLPSQDAWVVARGHTGTASIDSSASVWFNPAGLTGVKADEIRLEPSLLHIDESFTSATTGRTVNENRSNFFTPSAYAAHRLNDSVVLGLGVLAPYGLSSDWPTSSGFAGLATYNKITYITTAASVGWRITPSVAVGGSLEYSNVKADLNRLTFVAPGVLSSYGFKGSDRALSGNVGAQWKIDDQSSLGIHYQLPTTLHFDGTAALQGILSAPGHASGWTFADNLAIGYSYKITPDWEVEFDYDMTFWNRSKVVHLVAGPLSTDLALNWKRSVYYCFGVEHRINAEWRVATGYSYTTNSVPDLTFNPSLPDSSRNLFDGGIERTFGPWQIQLVAEMSLKSNRTISGPAPDGIGGSDAGTFHNQIFAGGTSVAYRF